MAESTAASAGTRRTSKARQADAASETTVDLKAAETNVNEVLKAAEEANAQLTARLKEAEQTIAKITAQAKAAQDVALADLSERLAARQKEAEAALEQISQKALEGARAAEAAVVKAARAASEETERNLKSAEAAGDKLRTSLTQALGTAEEGFNRLVAQAETDRAAAEAAMRQAAAVPQAALAGAGDAGSAVLDGMSRVRAEVADFVAERIRKDIETQAELLGCRNLGEIREVQSRFVRAAIDEYAAETTRLFKLGGELMSKALPR
jgi:chromosome segregation ATPase